MIADTSNSSYQTLSDVVRSFPNRGERDALCFFNGIRILRYSYRELYDLSVRCAAYLREKGVEKGDRILVWTPNRPEWGVLLCACALSGTVLVPLDARNTPDFVQRVGEETEAKLLFRSHARRDPGLPIPTVFMEDFFDVLSLQQALNSFEKISPDDALEIVYTSGTTGSPKGVVLTHGNIASNLCDILEIIPIDKTYRLLSVLPLSHALEQTAGFWAPTAGGGSILYLHVLKPSALFEAFQRERITVMILVPRLLALLKQRIESLLSEKHLGGYLRFGMRIAPLLPRSLRKAYFYPIHKRFNPHFHLFVSGGSSLPRDVETFWKSLGFELLQGYGLTETSPVLTATRPGQTRMGSVGPAMRQVELRLTTDNEIQAKGPNVFRGYYKNPGATAEVFDEEWFRTGDVGELDRDGFLYIRSRKKDVVVTSDGINVYPEDIEQVLDRHSSVKESCVVGMGEHEEIVHAVLLLNDGNADPSAIVSEVNVQLSPEQRIESWSVWMEDEFPKTTTLKIKKPEVRKKLSVTTPPPEANRNTEGTLLQQIVCEMADVPIASLRQDAQLGRDLGMSSIGRIELVSRIEEEFRLDIDDDFITAETTFKQLDRLISERVGIVHALPFRRWTLSPPIRVVRWTFDRIVIRTLLRIFCDVQCKGLENVKDIHGPVLIVSNHTSHVDTPLISSLLPPRIGARICPAAWWEYFDSRGQSTKIKMGKWCAWQIATIFFNIFPFPQKTGFRRSMAYAGELVDKGWNLLYYPEGSRSKDGTWGEFHEGVGILAHNLRIPVLPVVISGGEKILAAGKGMPKRNKINIIFGKPFFPKGQTYTQKTHNVIETLTELGRSFKK